MVTDSYLTIASDAEAEIVVKRSRFLCRVQRVSCEEQAREVVAAARSSHWDARHHCSAFIVEPDGSVSRSSDDGEPAGTAGMPILQALTARRLTEVVAVVTRWFGGTLLGTGGLVKAYSQATSAALAEAGELRRQLMGEYRITLSHLHAGRVEAELRSKGVAVLDVSYGEEVILLIGILSTQEAAVLSLVAEATAGRSRPVPAGQRWVDRSGASDPA